jgi:hypothetical protein
MQSALNTYYTSTAVWFVQEYAKQVCKVSYTHTAACNEYIVPSQTEQKKQ